MFCTNCGAQMPGNAIKCPQCGTSMGTAAATAAASAALSAAAQSGAIKGFIVLVVSFFTMPLKTLRLTVHQLREVGAAGSLGLGTTTLPHLTWLRVAGNFVVSVIIVGILLVGLYQGVTSLGQLKYSATAAIGGLIWKPIAALFAAVAADWVFGFVLELLGILVVISNDVRAIAARAD
jgi:RNA polymerase subunit RPABC4/transcription elongation factor Spt4